MSGSKSRCAQSESNKSALSEWRQGDFSRDCRSFVLLDVPEDSAEGYQLEAYEENEDIEGLVVVSQTCDIIRNPDDRPYVEVCPMVKTDGSLVKEAEKGLRPRWALVPGARDHGLVADLDRVMTIGKAALNHWTREEGCSTDSERIRFAHALERKRGRFAFPDEFTEALDGFRNRIRDKYQRDSNFGEALRSLREIRVRGAPDWESDKVEIAFLFIIDDENADRETISDVAGDLISKITLPANYSFGEPKFEVVSLDDITARDYVESVHLDYEHLSLARDDPSSRGAQRAAKSAP